ncbi:MAG: hypothetical protein V3S38_01840 [Acidimicrobiia bacterium]
MADTRTSEEILHEIGELDQQIAELEHGGDSWEQLAQTAEQAGAVETYIGSVVDDVKETSEDIGESADVLTSVGEKFGELLELPDFAEGVEGVQGGLKSSTNVLQEIQGGIGEFKGFVETLLIGEGLTSDNAAEQLQAASEAYEATIGKLEPFIELVPGLGAFVELWGLAIDRAAEVAEVVIVKTDTWNDTFSTIDGNEGDYLYFTAAALADIKLRNLKKKRAALQNQMMETAVAENEAASDIELPSEPTDRDIAIETAFRKSSGAQVPAMTPTYREWGDATENLEEASTAQGRAQENFNAQAQVADEAATAAETDTRYSDDRLTLKAESEARARDRAQSTLDDANANFDAALDRHSTAFDAHWAEVNGYRDAVRTNLIRIIPGTNSGQGFSDTDYVWLASTYPQFAVSREQVEAGSLAGAASGAAVEVAPTGAAGAVVGGAVVGAAAMSSGTKRLVMIGAGGALAGMMLLGAFIILPADAPTPGDLKSADPVTEIVAPSEESVSANEPDESDPGESDGSQDDVETAQVPPGLDPRAHVVSIVPYVTEDGTHGFIVGFSQAWDDGLPVLYSFFVELVLAFEGRSMTAGYETHAGTRTPMGPGPTFLLDDGTLAVDTGVPYSPENVFQVAGRSGSQNTSDSKATFNTYPESDVSTANATTIDPSQIEVVIDEGTPEHLKAAQPTAASNDGKMITITFAGNLKALIDGGAYKVRINAQATDDGIRVTVTLRSTDGELLLNGTTFNDEDKVGSSIEGKDVETTWVWSSDGNEVVIDMVSPDGVAIPSTSVTVAVTVQEQESSAPIDLKLQ